jgi:hypothetical protein
MNKESLVYIKENNGGFRNVACEFKAHTPYRCTDMDGGKLVNAEWFTLKEFNEIFDTVYSRVIKHWTFLGLIVNGEPISKGAFNKLASSLKYGRGNNMLYIIYFQGFDKDKIMYGFYPVCAGDSKAYCLNNAYRMFIDFINGDLDEFDDENIQFGNVGFRLEYGDLTKRFVQETEKSLF